MGTGVFTDGMFYLSLCFCIAIVDSPTSHLHLSNVSSGSPHTFPALSLSSCLYAVCDYPTCAEFFPLRALRSPCLCLSHVLVAFCVPGPCRPLSVSLVVVPNGFVTGPPSRALSPSVDPSCPDVVRHLCGGTAPVSLIFSFESLLLLTSLHVLHRSITISTHWPNPLVKMFGDHYHFYLCASDVCSLCLIPHHVVSRS